jgi:hypothetical protein
LDRSDVGGALGVAFSFVGATVAWIAGLGIITILFSVGLGALLTYLVQTRTQRTEWKREAGLRKVDEVYGPLYEEINVLAPEFSQDTPLNPYSRYSDGPETAWGKIQQGYRYYLIDSELRKELDRFFGLVKELATLKSSLTGLIDAKLLPRLRNLYGPDVTYVTIAARATQPNGSSVDLATSFLYGPILTKEQPLKFVSRLYPGLSDYRLEITIQRQAQTQKILFDADGPPVVDSEDSQGSEEEFNAIIKETSQLVDKDPTVLRIRELTRQASQQASALKETLRIKIEQPWRV